jgi:hypothetical protein
MMMLFPIDLYNQRKKMQFGLWMLGYREDRDSQWQRDEIVVGGKRRKD